MLDLTLEELLEFEVVTASKTAEKISEIPASVVVITREEIQKKAYTSLSDILQNITGVYMIDDYFWLGSTNYGVRGFFSTGQFNDMVILVNGVSQLSDKYGDYPDVKINVPVEAIERIEVIKGPMSVIYGTGAFFGAINIITTDRENNKGFASAALGNYGSQKANAHITNNSEKLKFTFNAAYESTQGIDVPFSDITSKTGILEYVGLTPNASTGGQRDDKRKYFNSNIKYENFFWDFSYAETQKDIFDGQPSFNDGSQMTTKATNIAFGYEKEFSEKFTTLLKLGYYTHGHVTDYSVFRPNYYEIDAQNTESYDFEWNFFFNLSEKINIISGIYRRTVLNIHQISDFSYYGIVYGGGEAGLLKDENYSTNAFFAQIKYSPFEKLKLVGGIRFEHLDDYLMYYSRGLVSEDPADGLSPDDPENRKIINAGYLPENNGLVIIPRFALLYSLNKSNVVKFLYGTATKQPSFSENYRQLPANRPQLEAAIMNTYELNYIANFNSKLDVSASIFYNQLDKLIVATNIYNQESGEWDIYSSNSGKMETQGVELGLKYHFDYKLMADFGVIYQKSKNLKQGYENIDLEYSPNLLFNAGIIYNISNNISLSLTGIYVDEMETYWKTESTPENGYRIGEKSKAYTSIDSKLKVSNIFNKNIFLELTGKNIFDSEIRYPTTTSNAWIDKGSLGFGRRLLISVGVNF